MARSKQQQATDRIKYIRERLSRAAEVEVEMLIFELLKLAQHSDDERIRLAAIKEILDRGAGKAAPVSSEHQMGEDQAVPPGFKEWFKEQKLKFEIAESELGKEASKKKKPNPEAKDA